MADQNTIRDGTGQNQLGGSKAGGGGGTVTGSGTPPELTLWSGATLLGTLVGSSADAINGTIALAPPGNGVALSLTGDISGANIQEWFVNATIVPVVSIGPDGSLFLSGPLLELGNPTTPVSIQDSHGNAGLPGQTLTPDGAGGMIYQNPSLKSATVTLATADVEALNMVPFILIAGNPGHYYVPVQVIIEYIFNTTPFVITGVGMPSFQFVLNGAVEDEQLPEFALAGFIDQTTSQIWIASNAVSPTGGVQNNVSDISGASLQLQLTSSAVTLTGDGSLKITVIYQDFTL